MRRLGARLRLQDPLLLVEKTPDRRRSQSFAFSIRFGFNIRLLLVAHVVSNYWTTQPSNQPASCRRRTTQTVHLLLFTVLPAFHVAFELPTLSSLQISLLYVDPMPIKVNHNYIYAAAALEKHQTLYTKLSWTKKTAENHYSRSNSAGPLR